jgi:branched-chain amino acid transport system substrate-binding protein
MAEFAYSRLGVKKVAVLYINNDYGVGLKNVFEKRFTELGGSIISTESYEQSSSDFRTQLSKLKTLNAEAIYLPGHTKELGQILKQAKELGIKVQFLSVVGFESPQTLQIAGDAAEGVIYTAPAFDPKSADKLGKQFVTKYRNKYGRDPENFAAHAYDAMNIIAVAIKEGGYSSEGIKKSLHKIKNYPGVSGLTTFDENGDVEKPAMLKTVRDGQFIPLSLPGNMKQ